MRGAAAALALAACIDKAAGPPVDPPVALVLSSPTIRKFELDCDGDAALWSLEVTATSWTAGGTLWWTEDGEYVEKWRVASVAQAPDGSSDHLRLDVPIVVDFRDETGTAFGCADKVNLVFQLLDRDSVGVDCRVSGPKPNAILDAKGVPECESAWEDTGR